MSSWSPQQYSKFEAERTRPVSDLLSQVPPGIARVVADLGCGPGNSTEVLRARFPEAAINAIDSSAAMVEAARKRLPDVSFEVAEIGAWQHPGPFDVILANAVLHWVPDHQTLLPALLRKLAPGGSLAVQMPDNLREPTHVLMRETAGPGPWDAARTELHEPSRYHQILTAAGAQVNIWRTVYFHPLAGAPAIVEWFKATGLRPFLDPLGPEERVKFLERYTEAVGRAYPALPDGMVLLPVPRLFFVATLP